MLRNSVLILIMLIIICPIICLAQSKGDKKIKDMKERILEEEDEEEEEEYEYDDEEDDDDDDSCCSSGCSALASVLSSSDENDEENYYNSNNSDGRGCSGNLFFLEYLFSYFGGIRYADYPYAPNNDYDFSCLIDDYDNEEKVFLLNISSDSGYIFDSIFETTAKVMLNFLFLHIDIFFQNFISEAEYFNVFSPNIGLSIPLYNIMLSAYCGFYKLDFLDEMLFSFGGSLYMFLPENIIFEFYNLNSFYRILNFNHFSFSLSYALARFTVGLGYNFNNYAETLYHGPMLKLSIWL